MDGYLDGGLGQWIVSLGRVTRGGSYVLDDVRRYLQLQKGCDYTGRGLLHYGELQSCFKEKWSSFRGRIFTVPITEHTIAVLTVRTKR